MATLMSLVNPIRSLTPKYLLKPRLYPLRPSSFHFRHRPHPHLRRHTVAASFSDQSPSSSTIDNNPLLQDFLFPPFDVIDASHVRPGMRALLNKLDDELTELEKTVEPSWSKLTEPLERIVDRLSVVWGAVNHLKAVKDNSELRSAIAEVQPEQITFGLKLDQSKPIYNAFKAIRESPEWETLSDARKRIVESSIKDAVLSGISLEDDDREEFNKIQQELAKLSKRFGENVLDATKKFEKLITDKKEIEGLPATALGLAAQIVK